MKMPAVRKVAATLVLLLLFAAKQAGGDRVNEEWQPEDVKPVTLSLDLSAGVQKYKSFMYELDRELALTTTRTHIEKRPVLGAQKYKPDHWIHVALKGNGESKLAIRADNIYLVGFQAQGGAWLTFKGRNNLIAGSSDLSFGDDYKSLTNGGNYKDLAEVFVGKKPAMEALAVLAKGSSAHDKDVKEALLRFVVMFCEAARFSTVRADIISAWEKEQGGHIGSTAIELTVNWRIASCALLIWDRDKKQKWDNIKEAVEIKDLGDPKMTSAEATAENVYCIIQPTATKLCPTDQKTLLRA